LRGPNLPEIILKKKNKLLSDENTCAILHIPTRLFTIEEVKTIIKNLNLKKMPHYDLITNQILQKILWKMKNGNKIYIYICNAVLKWNFFPSHGR